MLTAPRPLAVIDHTDQAWASRYDRRYTQRGRENGAATYSRDIVAHHLPLWRRYAPPGTVVSTCPLLDRRDVSGPVVVQYLHTYPYVDPTGPARDVAGHLAVRTDRLVFVTAYRALHVRLLAAGFEALHVPMTVDADAVRSTAGRPSERHDGRRAIYFGNVTKAKAVEAAAVTKAFRARGWQLDVISGGRFNGQPVDQREAWNIAGRYRYGVAVGRCALELHALSLRVMVSGAQFGGLVTTGEEWETQTACNFNGRVTTFDRDRVACVDAFDHAVVRPQANPVELGVQALRAGLVGLWDRGWLQ